jgi:hypothetical protein
MTPCPQVHYTTWHNNFKYLSTLVLLPLHIYKLLGDIYIFLLNFPNLFLRGQLLFSKFFLPGQLLSARDLIFITAREDYRFNSADFTATSMRFSATDLPKLMSLEDKRLRLGAGAAGLGPHTQS